MSINKILGPARALEKIKIFVRSQATSYKLDRSQALGYYKI